METFNYSREHKPLLEPLAVTLQRDIEKAVLQLDGARKEGLLLDEQIELIGGKLNGEMPRSRTNPRLDKELNRMHKNIEISSKKLSQIRSDNKIIRKKLEDGRRKILINKFMINELEDKINKCQEQATTTNQETNRISNFQRVRTQQMQMIRSKSDKQKGHFLTARNEMSSLLKEEKFHKFNANRQMNKTLELLMQRPTSILENANLAEHLLENLKEKIFLKKKAIESYTKRLKKITDSFEEIKLATGIKEITSVVTSVTKSEDQFIDIHKYLNENLAEIDDIRISNAKLMKYIQNKQAARNLVENDRKEMKQGINQRMNHSMDKINRIKNTRIKVDTSIQAVRDIGTKIINLGSCLGFKFQGGDEIQLITQIEDFIWQVLLLNAYLQRKKNPVSSTLPSRLFAYRSHPQYSVKDVMESKEFTEVIEKQDFTSPKTGEFLRAKARAIYESITQKTPPRTITPNPSRSTKIKI